MLSCRKQPSLKRNLFTVCVSFGIELHCGVVRMLTLTSLFSPFLPVPFFFLLSLHSFLCVPSPSCVIPSPYLHFCFSSRPGRPPKRTQSVTSPENHIMPHSVPGLMSPGIIPSTGNPLGPCILSGIPLVIC